MPELLVLGIGISEAHTHAHIQTDKITSSVYAHVFVEFVLRINVQCHDAWLNRRNGG